MKEIRMCIACRKRREKKDLIRIVLDKNNHAIVDENHKYNSRGIYICNDLECINKLKKMKDITKVVKLKVTNEEISKLICELGENRFWIK